MRAMLLTMEHSGTRFASEHFGLPVIHHFSQTNLDERIRRFDPEVIISTLRSPENMWGSYWRRSLPFSQLVHAWKGAQWLFDSMRVLWLPIDHPARDGWMRIICSRLGIGFNGDWSPVCRETDGREPPSADFSFIYDLPIAREFYG